MLWFRGTDMVLFISHRQTLDMHEPERDGGMQSIH